MNQHTKLITTPLAHQRNWQKVSAVLTTVFMSSLMLFALLIFAAGQTAVVRAEESAPNPLPAHPKHPLHSENHFLPERQVFTPAAHPAASGNRLILDPSIVLEAPSTGQLYTPATVTVTVYDGDGNVATGYVGQVQFTASDPQATLPANYTFTAGDNGRHTFTNGFIWRTPGPQTLTVTDVLTPALTAATPFTLSADVIINQNTTWNETSVTVGHLVITNNAQLLLAKPITMTANNITIHTTGRLSADSQGFPQNSGPGTPTNVEYGAAHGGFGYGRQATPYGNLYHPLTQGSGGRAGYVSGGSGGGVIHLIVTDTLTLHGLLSANGLNGLDAPSSVYSRNGGSGGSGGSVWIEAGTVTGTGTIQANGGRGGYGTGFRRRYHSGSGSGGRIALYALADTFSQRADALQARGGDNDKDGGAGTIYLNTITAPHELRVDNISRTTGPEAVLLPGAYEFNAIRLTAQGHLRMLGTTSVITLSDNTIVGDGTANFEQEGLLQAPSQFTLQGVNLYVWGQLAGPTVITTTNSGSLHLYADRTPGGVYTYTAVTVGQNTSLVLHPAITNNGVYTDDYGVHLRLNTLTIAGTVSADYMGYNEEQGPGASTSPTNGAAHGGYGYGGGATPYGDPYHPTLLGSGGGSISIPAGRGGGAVHLVVDDTLTLNGTLSANGQRGTDGPDDNYIQDAGSGGSGGAIWIETNVMTGTGLIQANGGAGGGDPRWCGSGRCTVFSASGAGGRIALYATADHFSSRPNALQAWGGDNPQDGGPGTIYLHTNAAPHELRVGNNGRTTGPAAFLPADTYAFDTLSLTQNGHLEVAGALTLAATAGDNSSTLTVQGLLTATAVPVLQNINITAHDQLLVANPLQIDGVTVNVPGNLVGADDIVITGNGRLHLYAQSYAAGTATFDQINIPAGTLTLAGNEVNGTGFTLRATDITIAAASALDANGQGYRLNEGAGAHANGASHGGIGGGGLPPYGSAYEPVTLGSSGNDGRGGGAIRLIVAHTLWLDGALRANGIADGSGGSLWVQTDVLTGMGIMSAVGGSQSGGGGRIAVEAIDLTGYGGDYNVAFGGGTCPPTSNCQGTIFLDTVDPLASTVAAAPPQILADGQATGTITVTLLAAAGLPVSNREVELQVTPGTDMALNGQPASDFVLVGTTDANGQVTAVISGTALGLKTISARTRDGELLHQTATILLTTGPADPGVSQLAVNKTRVAADGQDAAIIIATLLDSQAHPLSSKQVYIQVTGTAMTLTQEATITNDQGQVTATVRAMAMQSVTVSAYNQTDGFTLSQTQTITFTPAPVVAANSQFTITPTANVAADNAHPVTITAVLRDALQRPLANRPITLLVSGSGYQISPAPTQHTDAQGNITFYVTASQAGSKQLSLRDVTGNVVVPIGSVGFIAANVHPNQSDLSVLGASTAAADGQHAITFLITVRDGSNNPVAGATAVLTGSHSLHFIQPIGPTNSSGQTIGRATSTTAGQFVVQALVNGVLIADTAIATFMGPDLAISKSGPTAVTAGYPIHYNITVANQGYLAAIDVIITDTLPFQTSFITQTSPYAYTQSGQTIVWHLGDLPAGQSVSWNLDALLAAEAVIGSQKVNTVRATATEAEVTTANNHHSVTTLVETPQPRLRVTPLYPTLVTPQGGSQSLTITVRNEGTAPLTGAALQPPAFLPWVTLSQANLGDLQPGEAVTVTLIANAAALTQAGHYRDVVRVTSSNAGYKDVYLDVHVRSPLRDLHLSLINNVGGVVANGRVILTEPIYVETQGVPGSTTYYHEAFTDENGEATFFFLETDKAYNFSISAPNHQSQSGSVTLAAGAGTQAWGVTLNGRPGLAVMPESLAFDTVRGSLAQKVLTIRNTGVVTLTGISLTAEGIPFLFLGQPPVGTAVPPGATIQVSVNVAPTLTETADIYNGIVHVTAVSGQAASVPVTVKLPAPAARTLCLTIKTESGQPVTNALVQLNDMEGQIVVSGGVTETIQQLYTLSSDEDGPGYACFSNLAPGAYQAQVIRGVIRLGEETLEVVPGEGTQEETIIVDEPSVTANWSVVRDPFDDVYTTTLTLTFIPHEPPQLALSPTSINLCNGNGMTTQTIYIHNFYPVTLTQAAVTMNTAGNVTASLRRADGTESSQGHLNIGTIPPNADVALELTAAVNTQACQEGEDGRIHITLKAEHGHYAPTSWYNLFGEPQTLPLEPATIPLKLINDGFPESSNLNGIPPTMENITLTPPQSLTWLDVSTTTIAAIPVGGEVGFDLVVTPPQWLPIGFYYDYILINATNGITAFIGIEAEMTGQGLRINTQLVTPLSQGGTPPPPTPDQQQPPDWTRLLNSLNPNALNDTDTIVNSWDIAVGCFCTANEGWQRLGNQLIYSQRGSHPGGNITISPAPAEFKDNLVILQLQQKYSLEREAFTANLNLGNALNQSLTDLEVEILFTNAQGEPVSMRLPGGILSATGTFTPVTPLTSVVPLPIGSLFGQQFPSWGQNYPPNFIVIPESPTALPDLPGGQDYAASWTFIPDAMGLTAPAAFKVQAIIRYKLNGQDKVLETEKATITIQPQPRIIIDYFVPNYVLGGQTFDWIVVATNVGYGTAHNFRVETPQPKILKQSERYPTDFTLIGPSTLNFGNLAPGQQVQGVWRIKPSRDGSFVSWSAKCGHQNYKGVELPPLVHCQPRMHMIDTSYLAEAQQWGKGDSCMAGKFQGFDSDPVNTFSGNFTYSTVDLTIPTWSMPLQWERSYNSQDAEDGPLGPGWTHNYNLDLRYESFIGMRRYWQNQGLRPQGVDLVTGQQSYFIARLPHGSQVYFEVSTDGTTITPFPGVRAQLTRSFDTYRLTYACDDTVYIFNAQQKLAAIEDVNGNRTTLDYDISGNLIQVTDPSSRTLSFAYDANGHITQMTDPLGRTAVYTYTAGYLTAVADFNGHTTHYTYTPPSERPGQLATITDANGHTEVTNQYDTARRVAWQEDALGYRTTFVYSVNPETGGRVTQMTDPYGNTSADSYNHEGLLIQREDALGFSEQYAYDEHYNMLRQTDKNGRTTLYEWDECHCNITLLVDPMGNNTVMAYNSQKQPVSITNERGHVTTMTYDSHNNLLTVTNPAGGVKSMTYGPHGEKLSETDENDHTTQYGYDLYGNQTVITDALGHVTTMTYDLAGRLLRHTDPRGYATIYTYDNADNLLSMTNPLSGTTAFAYDPQGNRVQSIDALGRVTTFAFDARDQLVQTVNPAGGVQTFAYDALGHIVAKTDAHSRTTTYQFNGLTQITTNPLSGTVRTVTDALGNPISETDANGNVTHYVYDDNGRLVTTIYPDGSTMQNLYDEADNLRQVTDGEGRAVTYVYDNLGRVITETNPAGGQTIYTYDATGNKTGVRDAAGRWTLYAYDALNRPVQITDPAGGTITITYDAAGNRTAVANANDHTTTFTYDPLNRPLQVTDPLNGVTSYLYDAVGNRILIIDPLGRATAVAYDELNQPITLTNPANGVVSRAYDLMGNLVQITDEEGRQTTMNYDALNRVINITDAAGGQTTYLYDANGNVLAETNPAGQTTTYAYDELNQLITVTDPLSGTAVYTYDRVGNVLTVTDANGRVTDYAYDSLDRLVQLTDPLVYTRAYTYDPVGNVLAAADAEGGTTHYTYDALNRPLTRVDASGGTTTYVYDALNNLLHHTDAEGRATTYAYDALNRQVSLTDPLNQTTSYGYDAVGNLVRLTEANDAATTFAYDPLNQLITATNPLGHTAVYTYSPAGNLVAEMNPLGQITHYVYDDLNRQVQMVDSLGQVTTYTYDPLSNPIRVTDPLSRTTLFVYDPLNRLAQQIDALGGITTYTYDAAGNQTARTDANGRTVHYAYDALNRLVTLVDPLGQMTHLAYDGRGNQISLTDPLSRTARYAYDALSRLVTITDTTGAQATYTYDRVGNNTAVTDSAGHTTTVRYDALNRPVQTRNPLSGTTSVAYDAVGNPVNRTDAAGRTITYTYDALSRLIVATDPLQNNTIYTYDALGNLVRTTDPLNRFTTYAYDDLNRLVRVTDPLGGTSTLTYDAVGNLIGQRDPRGHETHTFYDALNRPITVTNPLNHTTSSVYDAVGNILSVTDARGQRTVMTYDALNRLVTITDPLGRVQYYAYDAVGNNTAVTNPLGQQTNFVYDPRDRLQSIVDPLNRVTTYTYDTRGNTVSQVDAAGITTHYAYDPLNRLTQVTENAVTGGPTNATTNVTTQFNYDPVGNLTAVTNPLGNSHAFTYDALNRLTSSRDPLNLATTYQYDPVGNLVNMVDANGHTTSYQHDALNRPTTILRPDELVQFTYDPAGNRLSMTDASGLTTYSYDAANRLTAVTDALAQTVQYQYDAAGNRIGLTYPGSESVTYSYDAANQLTTVTDWANGETHYTYDNAGRLIQVVLPQHITGTFGYDSVNQLTSLQYQGPTGTLAAYVYSYDQVGNRLQATETLAIASVLPAADFSAAPRSGVAPLSVTFHNAAANATTFIWNFGDGQVVTTTSTLSLTHVYTATGAYTVTLTAVNGNYSHTQQRATYIQVLPVGVYQEVDGQVVIDAEHAAANIPRHGQSWLTRTDFAGYAGEGYVHLLPDQGVLYTLPLTNSPELQVSISFATPGVYTVWVRGAANNAGSDSLYVGLAGDSAASQAITGLPPQAWGWSALTDAGGTTTAVPATLTIPTPGIYTLNIWGREDGLRLDRILLTHNDAYVPTGTGPAESPRAGLDQAALVDPDSPVTSWFVVTPPNPAAAQAAHNRDLLAANLLSAPGMLMMGPLAMLTALNERHRQRRRVQVVTSVLAVLMLLGVGWALAHGAAAGPGATLDLPGGSFLNPFRSTPATSETHETLVTLAQRSTTTTITYTYDPLYRLTAAAYDSGATFAYNYDAAGNRVSASANGAATTYTYDAANRLVQVNGQAYSYDNSGNLLSDGQATYAYDTANRLTAVSDGTTSVSYTYNGDGVRLSQTRNGVRTDYVQDVARPLPQVLAARQGSAVSRYLHGLGLLGEQTGTATWQYHLPDALGSVRQIANMDGQIILKQDFDPFGGLLTRHGSAGTAYGFTGEEQDPLLGLLYLRARTYQPGTGRFLQQDTVLGSPAQPRTLHRYAYAFNNPLSYTDPSGQMPAISEGSAPRSSRSGMGSMGQGAATAVASASPARSVNGRLAQTNPGTTAGSSGHGPNWCQLQKILPAAVVDLANELVDLTINLAELTGDLATYFLVDQDPTHLAHAWNRLQDVGGNVVNIVNNPIVQVTIQLGLEIALLMTPTGATLLMAADIYSLATGIDIRTGKPMSNEEKMFTALTLLPDVFDAIDDIADAASSSSLRRLDDIDAHDARHLSDDAAEAFDEAGDAARHLDEVDEVGDAAYDMRRAAKSPDELIHGAGTPNAHTPDAAAPAIRAGNDDISLPSRAIHSSNTHAKVWTNGGMTVADVDHHWAALPENIRIHAKRAIERGDITTHVQMNAVDQVYRQARSGKPVALGNFEDLFDKQGNLLRDLDGYQVLQLPEEAYTWVANYAYVQGALERTDTILIRSNPAARATHRSAKPEPSFFGGTRFTSYEFNQIQQQGWNFYQIGNGEWAATSFYNEAFEQTTPAVTEPWPGTWP